MYAKNYFLFLRSLCYKFAPFQIEFCFEVTSVYIRLYSSIHTCSKLLTLREFFSRFVAIPHVFTFDQVWSPCLFSALKCNAVLHLVFDKQVAQMHAKYSTRLLNNFSKRDQSRQLVVKLARWQERCTLLWCFSSTNWTQLDSWNSNYKIYTAPVLSATHFFWARHLFWARAHMDAVYLWRKYFVLLTTVKKQEKTESTLCENWCCSSEKHALKHGFEVLHFANCLDGYTNDLLQVMQMCSSV